VTNSSEVVHLRAAGTSLLLESGAEVLPVVRHWGADLGPLDDVALSDICLAALPGRGDSPFDTADQVSVLPEHRLAWNGRPGLQGSREGRSWSVAWRRTSQRVVREDDGTQVLVVRADDAAAQLGLEIRIGLTPQGVVTADAELVNEGPDAFCLGRLQLALPVPDRAVELLDFTGRHTLERVPQRGPFRLGIHAREARGGRPGLDSAYLLVAGTGGFGFRTGEVWGVHVGWSGNQQLYAERTPNGASLLGGGELLEHGEVRLEPGASYRSAPVVAVHAVGLDGLSARLHAWMRSRPGHPRQPRPVILNTWEAVYFDHDLDRLTALADRGAEIGAERFVLDDGWFGGRRDDTSSLGDWTVSEDVWPDGLGPLVDHVHSLGMEFGLWVEPEMVNLDSDLARQHPEWVFSAGGRTGPAARQQHVLDLAHPEAYTYVRDRLVDLLQTYQIAFLKWDHNRPLHDAGHTPAGTPGVHEHTLAVYRLMDELRARFPGLEIESCAGGGGRIDLGVLQRTDRVWASDCIDPLERQSIQRWTRLLIPPELVGTHVGAPTAHTTGRTHGLDFRAEAAIWGHMGVEWDVSGISPEDAGRLKAWITFHKEHRDLLHTGTVVNADHPADHVWVHGIVAQDRSSALYSVAAMSRGPVSPLGRLRLPGLDPERRYAVTVPTPGVTDTSGRHQWPIWARDGVTMTGLALGEAGVQMVPLDPERSHLIEVAPASD
jgi:alpha-galactosidase